MLQLIVSSKGSLTSSQYYPTITDALNAIPASCTEPVEIQVGPGVYTEKVTIAHPNVSIKGTHREECILTYGDYAFALMPDGSKRGTFRSYTCFVDADHVTLENLTIRNSSAPRSKVGQAIALYADGDHLTLRNCRLESFQDTLFTGPLPPTALQPGGFTGPKEFAPRRVGRQLYENCTICGDIDFIFGSAIAFFDRCEIVSVVSEEGTAGILGYATAASTPEGLPYGYVFDHCRFTGNLPKGSVYLGRPWRDYAKTVLLHCYLGEHIHPAGFHDWNKPAARERCCYAEYQNFGPGASASKRDPFVHQLSAEEATLYTRERVLNCPVTSL